MTIELYSVWWDTSYAGSEIRVKNNLLKTCLYLENVCSFVSLFYILSVKRPVTTLAQQALERKQEVACNSWKRSIGLTNSVIEFQSVTCGENYFTGENNTWKILIWDWVLVCAFCNFCCWICALECMTSSTVEGQLFLVKVNIGSSSWFVDEARLDHSWL